MSSKNYSQPQKIPKNWRMICPTCQKEVDILEIIVENNSTKYKFACGHSHIHVVLQDTIKIWESLKGKLRHGQPGEVSPHKEFIYKTMPSGDPHLPEGVRMIINIDRENNKYDQVVIDLKTGKIIHEEHELLDQHKSKK